MYSVTLSWPLFIKATLFDPEKNLSLSFSYLKSPFNRAKFLYLEGDRIYGFFC